MIFVNLFQHKNMIDQPIYCATLSSSVNFQVKEFSASYSGFSNLFNSM